MKTWLKGALITMGIIIGLFIIYNIFAVFGPNIVATGGGLKPSENQFQSSSWTSFLCEFQGDNVYHYCNIPNEAYDNLDSGFQYQFELFCWIPEEQKPNLDSCLQNCEDHIFGCTENCPPELSSEECATYLINRGSCDQGPQKADCLSHCENVYTKTVCTVVNTNPKGGGQCNPDSEWYTHSECSIRPLIS